MKMFIFVFLIFSILACAESTETTPMTPPESVVPMRTLPSGPNPTPSNTPQQTDQQTMLTQPSQPSQNREMDQTSQTMETELEGGKEIGLEMEMENPPVNNMPEQTTGDENTNELCSDGIDNDGNGFVDCDDFSCSRSMNVTICDD